MALIKLKGNPINTVGDLPSVGKKLPDFKLTNRDLKDLKLKDYLGKKIVINIFPSIDTSVCAASVRRFNQAASKMENTVVLCVSKDLPFAHKRFCGAEGLKDVIPLSSLRNDAFEKDYGVRIMDGPMEGLMARVVIVADREGTIVYSEQVPDIVEEPNYKKAVEAAKAI